MSRTVLVLVLVRWLVVVALGVGCGAGGGGGGGAAPGAGGAAPAAPAAPPAGPPATVAVTTPAAGLSGDIAIDLTVSHPSSLPVDVEVEGSADGGATYFPTTPAAGAAGPSGLASAPAPAGAVHRYVWASAADLGATDQRAVRLRVTPVGPARGAPAQTGVFDVLNSSLPGAVLARYPYVQRVDATSALILWKTTVPQQGAVEYGPTPALGSVAVEGAPGTAHRVEIAGLAPGSTAHYRVLGDGARLGPVETFRVPDPAAARVRFAVVGDSGNGGRTQRRVADLMRAADPDFYLHTGDVIYPAGEERHYDERFFDPYRENARRAPFFPSLGNHDIIAYLGDPYLEAFEVPRTNPARSERYYAFEWGPARFLALDTSLGFIIPGSPQHLWLIDELNRPGPWTWTFAFHHHPPYSSSPEFTAGSNLLIRHLVSPLYEQAGVDVVFTGHAHVYERTRPRRDFAGAGPGVVYIVTGGGGAGTHPAGTSSFTAVSVEAHHYVLVEIDGRTLTATAIRDDGSVLDAFTIAK